MKKILIVLAIFVAFLTTLYIWDQSIKHGVQQPTIHELAVKPDNFLLEALDSEDKHLHKRSAIKIELAIEAIWKLEPDLDAKNFERLEQTIKKLELVHRKIIRDSIPNEELLNVLNYALGNLTYVELEVAAKYTESNQTRETRAAIKYARLHLQNALILHKSSVTDDDDLLASEIELLDEIDSLLNRDNLSQSDYSTSLDKMISDCDKILSRLEEK